MDKILDESPEVIYLSEEDWKELERIYKERGQGAPRYPLLWGIPIRLK